LEILYRLRVRRMASEGVSRSSPLTNVVAETAVRVAQIGTFQTHAWILLPNQRLCR
jgi:hypothetical protein